MKRVSAFLLLLLLIVAVQAQTVNPVPIVNLLDRVTCGNADKFVTVVDESVADSGKDAFVITSADGKPCVKGSNVLAVATGVNWYLNHYAHINLTWNNPTTNLDGVSLPLPATEEKHISSAVVRWNEVLGHASVINEIDVMATRGVIPLFISCKVSDIKTEALNELAILRDRFGGKGAKAAIVSTGRCNAAARHRAAQLGIAVIDRDELETGKLTYRLKVIMKVEDGES